MNKDQTYTCSIDLAKPGSDHTAMLILEAEIHDKLRRFTHVEIVAAREAGIPDDVLKQTLLARACEQLDKPVGLIENRAQRRLRERMEKRLRKSGAA